MNKKTSKTIETNARILLTSILFIHREKFPNIAILAIVTDK